MMHKLETPLNLCNLKTDNKEKGTFKGYASVFNSNDHVNDTILKGAFAPYEDQKIPMFINHGHREIPVGSYKGREDDYGFFVEGEINLEHKDGPSLYSALARGDISGQSIGFMMSREDYEQKDDGGRIIKSLELREISVVTFPCDPKALVTAVKNMEQLITITDLEHFIRDEFGASRSLALKFLSHSKRVMLGDLVNAEEKIKELEQRLLLEQASQSLLKTLETIGVN